MGATMNILLLGASGYLGGNIACRLCDLGHKVICVVRRTSNIDRLKGRNLIFISNDIDEIEITMKTIPIDWVINGVCTYKRNDTVYGDMLDSNLIFPLAVLNLAVKHGVNNYMTMGTSLPCDLNLYSFSKNMFSRFGEYLSGLDGMNFVELKLELFYGGLFEPTDRFISSCLKRLRENMDIELTKGDQHRDIIRVEDIIGIIERLMNCDYVKGYLSLPVGTGESHSIKDILSYMKSIVGSRSELLFGAIPERNGEPETKADISWYKEIDYELQYSFWGGISDECKRVL